MFALSNWIDINSKIIITKCVQILNINMCLGPTDEFISSKQWGGTNK